jgi:hypothetical protein
MADSDPVSSATRPHGVQPAGDADRRRQQSARRRRKRAKARDPEPDAGAPDPDQDGGNQRAEDETADQGPRGRHLDVRV